MKRIEALIKYIYPYSYIADVGCDHGYLIIEAFKKYPIKEAIAIDNKIGPLNQAKENMKKNNLFDSVMFSLSSGIKCISDRTECVVIAGMGGMLINDILKDDLKNVKRLILQPNRDVDEVRRFVCNKYFKIAYEEIVYENSKYYEIIVFDKVENKVFYTNDEYDFGPILLREKNEVFINKYQNEIEKLSKLSDVKDIKDKIERIKKLCL